MMVSNAMVKRLTEENVLLRNESSPAEVRQLKKSLVELRYSYRRFKITSKKRERNLKQENYELKKQVCKTKTENDLLQLQLREQEYDGETSKCINTKSDEKTYSVSCRKAIYCCLEYHVPVGNICPLLKEFQENWHV